MWVPTKGNNTTYSNDFGKMGFGLTLISILLAFASCSGCSNIMYSFLLTGGNRYYNGVTWKSFSSWITEGWKNMVKLAFSILFFCWQNLCVKTLVVNISFNSVDYLYYLYLLEGQKSVVVHWIHSNICALSFSFWQDQVSGDIRHSNNFLAKNS